MHRWSHVIAIVSFVACAAAPAVAQSERLAGHVADAQGAAIVKATVTLTSRAGTTAEAATNPTGDFVFDRVAPGPYTMEVDAPGFVRWKQTVDVSTAPAPLSIVLRVAGVREAVDVVGSAGLTLTEATTTGSRLEIPALDTPASVFVMPGVAVRDRGAQTMNDAKARITGVTIRANPGNGFNGLAARGFGDSGSVMQLFDGALMLVGASTVTFPFDPWVVERIEYLAGPASVLYGNGAIGGVLNVVPRRPSSSKGTEVRFGAGSVNAWRGAADTSGSIGGNTSYRLNFSGNRSSGWLKNTPSDSTAFSASVRHQFSPSLSLTVSEDFGYQRPGNYFGSPTIGGVVDPTYRDVNYNISDSEIWFRDSWTMAKVDWRLSPNVRLTTTPRILAAGRHFRDVEQYVFNSATNKIDRASYFEAFHRQRQYGDETVVVATNRLFGRTNTMTAGLDYNYISFKHTNNSPFGGTSVTDLENSTPGTFVNVAGTLPKYLTDTDAIASYVEDRLALSSKVSVVGGVRVDRYGVHRRDLITNATTERTYTPVSWRAGSVFAVKPGMTLYGQVAQATDTFRNVISATPAQSLFDPTIGRQVEGGVKQSLPNHRAEWTLAGYYIRKTKLVVPVAGQPGVQQQVGAQSSRGFEASATVNLSHGVRVEGNLAVLDARFDDFAENAGGTVVSRNGNTPPSVPENSANLWVTWTAPHEWVVRGGLRSVGRRYWDNANTSTIPGYTVVDGGVRKRLTRQVAIDLYLYNLTNELYGTDVYFNAFAPQWMLGVPRSAELAFSFGF